MKKLNSNGKSAISGAMVVVLFAMLCSCASTKSASVDTDLVYKNGFMMAKPIVVDIKVEKRKIEGSAVIKNSLYGKEAATRVAKSLAVIDAVKKGDADILVQPMFEVESSNSYTTARVSGYAAKYKEFRDVTTADTLAFKVRGGLTSVANYAAPDEVSVTKKGKQGLILLITLGAVLLIYLLIPAP